jgi:hypothetical protein
MNTWEAVGYGNSRVRNGHQKARQINDKRNEIRLEFVQVDVQGTSKAKRDSDRRDDLSDKSIQIGESRQGNPEVLFADPEDRFVVNLNECLIIASSHDNNCLTMKEQSACSKVVWVVSTELYGSTTELAS